MRTKVFSVGSALVVASAVAGCSAGATSASTPSPASSSTSTNQGATSASVDFFMSSSQCVTPCPMGAPVLDGASIVIEAVIENADPTQSYSFSMGQQQSAYLEYNQQTCYCGQGSNAQIDCSTSCADGSTKSTIVSASIYSNQVGTAAFDVVDDEGNVIGSSSITIEDVASITTAVETGASGAVTKLAAGGDGAYTVAANALVEITYAPVDATGEPLMFSQNALSATYSNPAILGPASSTAPLPASSELGTNNVVYLSAGANAGDASISLSANSVQSALNFHVTQ